MTYIIITLVLVAFAFGGGFIAGVKNAGSSKVKPFKKSK